MTVFYPRKGILISRNLTRSLRRINTPSDINAMKKKRLMYHSIVKYFSGLSLAIRWIITPSNLPPSNAGIGKTLNIANASDIIPANPR